MAADEPDVTDTTATPFGAVELRDRLAAGRLSVETLATTCLARIEAREADVQAWAWLDAEHVLAQAQALDARRKSGRPIGPLHGMPVAIKDIIDTLRMPTANGTPIDAGRTPTRDAWLVDRLKAAGALLMGKSVTTELAFMAPSKTRNPLSPMHSPGGSSSGSAAAVAADMVPLSIGTQTGGSVIRPASYCGVTGFKPSFGAIPRTGILRQSPSLDTVGVFARSVDAVAMLAEHLYGYDTADPATAIAPFPRLLDTALSAPPVTPLLAFVRPPQWREADADLQAGLHELVAFLGTQCFEAELPAAFDGAHDARLRINLAEMARNYHHYHSRAREQLSDTLQDTLQAGNALSARDYLSALDWPTVLNAGLDEIFERCDAIITAAATGPAPLLSEASTGSPIFNGLWTLCGTPCITVPLLESATGMPMGVQLVGRRGDDARLLRTARWLVEHMAAA